MRGVKHIIFVFILLGFVSCEKKKYPESTVENEYVFYVQGNLNYTPLKLVAGVDDYFMHSSYALDSNSVYSFSGDYRKLNCTDCRNTVGIRVRDYKASPNGIPHPVDSSLKAGSYLFVDRMNDEVFTVRFRRNYKPLPGAIGESVHWTFGDGTSSNALDPDHVYKTPGKYTVCLTVKSENGCEGSVCNEINVSKTGCIAYVTSALSGDRTVQFSAMTPLGKSPFKCLWNFGDGTFGESGAPTHTYKHDGSYPVVLSLTDANNQTVTSNYNIVTKKDMYSCVPNIEVMSVFASKLISTAGVTIEWTDPNGVKYTTDRTAQLPTSYFIIDKVEDFTPNEKGQKTKKLHVRFNCIMSDGKQAIPFTNGQAVVCVAIP